MRAIHYASWQGHVDAVAILLKFQSDPNEAADDGQTPLHWACEHGHTDVVRPFSPPCSLDQLPPLSAPHTGTRYSAYFKLRSISRLGGSWI